jgi:DNA polymerase-4
VESVEVVGLDEAYLDLSGLLAPRAAMRRLVAEIADTMGLTCSVGIGPNKLVAKVASDAEKPAGFVVLDREAACARFASSPPGLIPGIGPKTAARLAGLGLHTLAAVASAPDELLATSFGPNHGHDLKRRARFESQARVGAQRKVVSESRERTFERDISDLTALRAELERMAHALCASLAERERAGRTIGIKVRLDDFTTITRARTLQTPTCDADTVASVADALLREYDPARPVRLLGVRVAGLQSTCAQEPERGQPEDGAGGAQQQQQQLSLPVTS